MTSPNPPNSTPPKPVLFFASPPYQRQSTAVIQQLQSLHWSFSPTSILIDCMGTTPHETLDQLYTNRGRINIFHFVGNEAQFTLLQEGSKAHPLGDLYSFFGQEKELKLLLLAGCGTTEIVQSLRRAGAKAVISYAKHLAYEKISAYVDHLYQQLQRGATLQAAHQDAIHCITIASGVLAPSLSAGIYLSASEEAGAQSIWPRQAKRKQATANPPTVSIPTTDPPPQTTGDTQTASDPPEPTISEEDSPISSSPIASSPTPTEPSTTEQTDTDLTTPTQSDTMMTQLTQYLLQLVDLLLQKIRTWLSDLSAKQQQAANAEPQSSWLKGKRKQFLSGVATGGLLLSLWNNPQSLTTVMKPLAVPIRWLCSLLPEESIDHTTPEATGQNGENSGVLDSLGNLSPVLFTEDTSNEDTTSENAPGGAMVEASNDTSYLPTAHYQTPITQVRFTPDGSRLAVADRSGSVRLWDVATRQEKLALKGHASAVKAIVFSPDGSYLFSASDNGVIHQWSSTSGELIRSFVGHQAAVNALAFHPQQMMLASAGEDGTIRLWDAVTGEQRGILEGKAGAIMALTFMPNGGQLVTGRVDGVVALWDIESGQQVASLYQHPVQVSDVDVSSDGRWIVSASEDGSFILWDTSQAQAVHALRGHQGAITSIQFDPTGTYILTAGQDQTLHLWQTQSGELLRTWQGHSERLSSARFSPNGSLIASASWDGSVRLWEVGQKS